MTTLRWTRLDGPISSAGAGDARLNAQAPIRANRTWRMEQFSGGEATSKAVHGGHWISLCRQEQSPSRKERLQCYPNVDKVGLRDCRGEWGRLLIITEDDPLEDFELTSFDAGGLAYRTYVSRNAGPSIIVLHELPQLTPQVAVFARVLRDSGFKVWMPSLVGAPGKVPGLRSQANIVKICIRREFNALIGGSKTRPVVAWIRALAVHAAADQDRSVGIVGMCFSGGFALATAIEPVVAGAVLCQPALPISAMAPFGKTSDIDVSDADMADLRTRMDAGGLRARLYRFHGDTVSPCARNLALSQRLGPGISARCLPNEAADPLYTSGPKWHSVVTNHLIDAPGEKTAQARDEIVRFFHWRLNGGPEVVDSSEDPANCYRLGCREFRSDNTAIASAPPLSSLTAAFALSS